MINIKQAQEDPSSVFATPQEVLLNSFLKPEQKIAILRRWESELRAIQVAEEENMQGVDVIVTLEGVLNALHTLEAKIDVEHTPPTKQGG